MKNHIKQLVIPLSILLFSASTYGNTTTELGEFCFSGTLLDDGNCNVRLEITEHIVNFSISGRIQCDGANAPLEQYNSISGFVNGTGHIEGNDFVGALISNAEVGKVGVSPSLIIMNPSTIKVDLSTLKATFRKNLANNNSCAPDPVTGNRLCMAEAVLSFTACP